MERKKKKTIIDLLKEMDLSGEMGGSNLGNIPDKFVELMKSEAIKASFMKRVMIVGNAKSDIEAGKMLRGLENGLKEDMFNEIMKAISELHLHQPYAFLGESKAECVGRTRFGFIMANTQEDWDTQIKDIADEVATNPLPKLAELPEKLQERFTRYREAAINLGEDPEEPKDKSKAVKIPVTDA